MTSPDENKTEPTNKSIVSPEWDLITGWGRMGWKKWILAIFAICVVGMGGNALWEGIKFLGNKSWYFLLDVFTWGLESLKNEMYQKIANGHHELAATHEFTNLSLLAAVLFLFVPIIFTLYFLKLKSEIQSIEKKRRQKIREYRRFSKSHQQQEYIN